MMVYDDEVNDSKFYYLTNGMHESWTIAPQIVLTVFLQTAWESFL